MSETKKDSFLQKFTDIIFNFRNIVLFLFILVSFVALNFQFGNSGVVINGVSPNSPAENSGMTFSTDTSLTGYEKILYLNNHKIDSVDDFYSYLDNLNFNSSLTIRTDFNPSGYELEITNSTLQNLGFSIRESSNSNVRLGIELEGGSRLILKPISNLSTNDFDSLVNALQSRLDVYGASGTKVNKLEDAFSNEKFIIVESISANKNDIFELIKRAGEFEARISNETVFTGNNILRVVVEREVFEGCSENLGEFTCTTSFPISIDIEGVDNFFEKTSQLDTVGGYLSEKVSFYLDGNEITSLNIASSFKYNKVTTPSLTISGNSFSDKEKAQESMRKEVKFIQAILSTQSLPSELEVVQSYSIASSLGKSLLDNAILVGITSLFIVSGVIALRYRKWPVFIGIFIALAGEVIIVFGIAAFMKLSIDLAAIGGLIAAIGTGVDDQVIITDEYFRKRKKNISSRKRIKNAIYIIMIAYFTTLAAMIPLYFAGLKILQGFAFMILIGVTVGVLVTRPAYAAYLRIIMTSRKERKEEDEE